MPFDPGQRILVSYPFTDQTAAKLRPALVISSGKFNQGEDFVAVPISSRVDAHEQLGYRISETEEYFEETKLRCSSTVKWAKLMTLSATVVQRKLGVAPKAVLLDIQEEIRAIFTWHSLKSGLLGEHFGRPNQAAFPDKR